MRIIDLHCYPGTREWITAQGPYVDALAKYWNRTWAPKTESEVLSEFAGAGVEAVLVALDLETTIATPPCTNEYVHGMWKRHPERIIHAWGSVDPFLREVNSLESMVSFMRSTRSWSDRLTGWNLTGEVKVVRLVEIGFLRQASPT